jgi:aminoglycoside/choline kinase family phosphotransferase
LAVTERRWYLSGARAASAHRQLIAPLDAMPDAPSASCLPDFVALRTLAESAFPSFRDAFDCTPMAGGGGTRKYFRLRTQGGGQTAGGGQTVVAMFVPEGAKPEEIAKDTARTARWPFLEIRDLLAARGIDVPAVYAEDTPHGWVLLEDLGDTTLAEVLLQKPETREELYVRAARDVARAQSLLAKLPAESIVASRAFDEDLLHWEIQHFREWAIAGRGIPMTADDGASFDALASRIAKRIAALPRVFVHRDFQSRNLMVRPNGSLCWIDFQDALLGPRVYDLVALLNDSYQSFDRAFVTARLADYATAASLDASEHAAVLREFDSVTVQRKLKDAGRFVFFDRVKGNPAFLKFVEPTIAKVRASLARLRDDDDMRALEALLARVLPG